MDSSGNPLYTSATTDGTLIATIINCTSANLSNCNFNDSEAAGTGFSTRKIYNYLLVAQDAAGNQIPGMVQRWRSPYFAGDPAVSGAASFRLEPRYRRAAVFLVDEAHQQAQTRPQIMVHVPMDQSGLDHDFFMHKYEASGYDGTVTNNSPAGSSAWPQQADGSGNWLANAAQCEDIFQRTGSLNLTGCGDGSNLAATTRTVQSKQGVAPQATIDQGALWKACRNTGLTDADGNIYYLSLPSDAEWLKAADWGDLDLNGTIDVNPIAGNVSASIEALENATSPYTTAGCNTNSRGTPLAVNSTQTANCRSRFGAADMVGNVWEWTTGQIFTAVGYDNGSDGLWLGQTLVTTAQTKYDLVRGFYKSSAAPTITLNGDGMWYQTSLRASFRGGILVRWRGCGAVGVARVLRSVEHEHGLWRALPSLSPAEKISDQRFSLQRLALLPARSAG